MAILEAAAVATTLKFVQPLVTDLYQASKKAGAKGLARWGTTTFPSKLARRINLLDSVKTLWSPDDAVSIRKFFHPPRVRLDKSTSPQIVTRLSDLGAGNIVIEGIVGQGKSILLRSLAISEILDRNSPRLPIFLELRTLSEKLGLSEALHRQLESFDIDIDEETLDFLYRSNKITILFDGFDELEEDLIKQTFLEIESLAGRYPELQIVVSSRPAREIQKSALFKTIKIQGLSPAEYPAFLSKLGVSSEKSIAVRQAIKDSPAKISSLISTPLMLTMVVLVYEASAEIPQTLPEFFERLFQTVFSRHDKLKPTFERKHYSGLSEHRLQRLFEAFCFMNIQLGHSPSLNATQFREVFENAIKYSDENCKCEVENFKLDIARVACLMLEEGLDTTTFLHKSIMEYFSASFVKNLDHDNALLFYADAVTADARWTDVLTFLRVIDGYRYTRYYHFPVIEKHQAELIAPSRSMSDAELIDLVKRTYPGLGCNYKQSKAGDDMELSSVSVTLKRSGEHVGDFSTLLMRSIFEMMPSKIPLTEFQEHFGPIDLGKNDEDNNWKFVDIKRCTDVHGIKALREAFNVLESRMLQESKDATAVLMAQDKKKNIFRPQAT